MTNILIYGAGSIGNHLSQSARKMQWDVTVVDTDPAALKRMQEDIYPSRYGSWDEGINLVKLSEFKSKPGDFDLIMIGTPPDSHLKLATESLSLKPKILHIEKPLGTPIDDYQQFLSSCEASPSVLVTVGYDHAVASSVSHACDVIRDGLLGDVLSIDSLTREHWAGIFGAHPWLAGPHDSYLGYWKRGGGALCEHSHALHLGLVFAAASGWGDMLLQTAWSDVQRGQKGEVYDRRSDLILTSHERKGTLRVTQDVITRPTEKKVTVVGEKGSLQLSLSPTLDQVKHFGPDGQLVEDKEFTKNRPADFFSLMEHYKALVDGEINFNDSPLRLELGLKVMAFATQCYKQYS